MAVTADRPGLIAAIDTRAIGIAVVELGGGRRRAEDRIDPSVGFTELAGLGAAVGPGAPLAMVHARNEAEAGRAAASLRAAYRIGEDADTASAAVHLRIAPSI